MINDKGEAVYFNPIRKNGKDQWLIQGIGGFPLIWEWLNGKGSCLWASEIEDFPIAVTKEHFPESISPDEDDDDIIPLF